MDLEIAFLNDGTPELLRVNLLLTSLTIQRLRMSEAYWKTFILLAPDKEHKKVFPEVPIVGFWNGKSLKNYQVRAALLKMVNAGASEPYRKGTWQVCDHIITTKTFTTKACGEVFKIQSGPRNCNSRKFIYLLRCKICDDTPYVGKAKTRFRLRFNNYKSKHRSFRKEKQNVTQKHFH